MYTQAGPTCGSGLKFGFGSKLSCTVLYILRWDIYITHRISLFCVDLSFTIPRTVLKLCNHCTMYSVGCGFLTSTYDYRSSGAVSARAQVLYCMCSPRESKGLIPHSAFQTTGKRCFPQPDFNIPIEPEFAQAIGNLQLHIFLNFSSCAAHNIQYLYSVFQLYSYCTTYRVWQGRKET